MKTNQEQIVQIIKNIENIFEITSDTKKEIFEKMSRMNDDEIKNITQILIDYQNNSLKNMKDMIKFLKTTNNKIDEIKDKKDETGDLENLFDKI